MADPEKNRDHLIDGLRILCDGLASIHKYANNFRWVLIVIEFLNPNHLIICLIIFVLTMLSLAIENAICKQSLKKIAEVVNEIKTMDEDYCNSIWRVL